MINNSKAQGQEYHTSHFKNSSKIKGAKIYHAQNLSCAVLTRKSKSWHTNAVRSSKEYTTVTPFSKALALAVYLFLSTLGFWVGMQYQRQLDLLVAQQKNTILYTVEQSLHDFSPNEVANQ